MTTSHCIVDVGGIIDRSRTASFADDTDAFSIELEQLKFNGRKVYTSADVCAGLWRCRKHENAWPLKSLTLAKLHSHL